MGEITYLSGDPRLLGSADSECDGETGVITVARISTLARTMQTKKDDFQKFRRFITGHGQYLFRTIKPVSYQGRCPHVHSR